MEPYRGGAPLARSDDEERARNAITRDLVGDERILWAGRPKQGVYLVAADAIMIPFSLAWGGFAIFWEVMAITMGAPLFFCLFGAPFVLIGLYMMIGRFFFDARRRARTFYGVTNRRVLIVHEGGTRKTVSIDLARGEHVRVEERGDGTGSIAFGPGGMGPSVMPMRGRARAMQAPTFERVSDVRAIMAAIAEAQSSSRSP